MKTADFNQAILIITAHHSNEIQINKVKPNGQVSPVLASPTIIITKCCASVVNKLIADGFSLSMYDGGLYVDKF